MKYRSYALKGFLFVTVILSNMVCSDTVGTGNSANSPDGEVRNTAVTVTIGGVSVNVFEHPRLWLSPLKIARLKEKAVDTNLAWVGLEYTNGRQLSSGTYKTTADSTSMFNFALGYLGNGSADYLNAAKTLLAAYPSKYNIACDGSVYCGNDNIDYGSFDLIQIALVYDWLHDQLSGSELSAIREWVFAKFIPFLQKHPYYYISPTDKTHPDASPVHNLTHTKWIGEFLWSLATVGDDDRALPILDQQYTFWRDQMAPIFDKAYVGGHSYGGSGYGYNRSYKFVLYGMEALKTATSADGYAGHEWAKDGLLFRFHSVLPNQALFHSDWESSAASFESNQGRMTENEALLVRRFNGTAEAKWGQYFLNKVYKARAYANQGGNRVNPYYVGFWFVWYDPEDEEVSYFDEPTAYVASGLGVGFSRTSWSDTSSAWASFSSADYYGDHQLHNEGSFKIWKNGEYLVVENGPCYAATNPDTNTSPIDANILFIGTGMYSGIKTGGLGGRGNLTQASILRFSRGSTYAYFLGNLKQAYLGYSLNTFHRAFVHFHPASGSSDDYFVVADRIDATDTWQKQQFIHVVKAPDTVSSPDATISTSSNYLHVRALNGTTLASQAPLSGDRTAGCLTQEATDNPKLLTVTRPAGTAKDLMMTLLHAGPTDTMPATDTLTSDGGELAGVLVKSATQNRVFLMGTASDRVTGTLSVTVTPTATAEYVVSDLPPSQKYDVSFGGGKVTMTPSSSGSSQADDQGVLRFVQP